MKTGWFAERPDEAPALPMTDLLMSVRGPQDEGRTLGQVLARAHRDRDPDPDPFDPDEKAANLLARGYAPGQLSQLQARLAETQAELQGEREKIERCQRRQERIQRDHQAGRITVADIMRMDLDEGDPDKVVRLERRAASLQRQMADAAAVISPSREQIADPLEAASRHAHREFVEATRRKMADAAAGRAPRARRPFGSISRGGGVAVRSEQCVHCTAAGVDDETAFLLHSDPDFNVPVTSPAQAEAER